MPPGLFEAVQPKLLGLHRTAAGRATLGMAGIERMVRVADRDYDPIRRMACEAQDVKAVD